MTCLPPPGTASGTTHVLRCDRGDIALIWRGPPERAWWAPAIARKDARDFCMGNYRYIARPRRPGAAP